MDFSPFVAYAMNNNFPSTALDADGANALAFALEAIHDQIEITGTEHITQVLSPDILQGASDDVEILQNVTTAFLRAGWVITDMLGTNTIDSYALYRGLYENPSLSGLVTIPEFPYTEDYRAAPPNCEKQSLRPTVAVAIDQFVQRARRSLTGWSEDDLDRLAHQMVPDTDSVTIDDLLITITAWLQRFLITKMTPGNGRLTTFGDLLALIESLRVTKVFSGYIKDG